MTTVEQIKLVQRAIVIMRIELCRFSDANGSRSDTLIIQRVSELIAPRITRLKRWQGKKWSFAFAAYQARSGRVLEQGLMLDPEGLGPLENAAPTGPTERSSKLFEYLSSP